MTPRARRGWSPPSRAGVAVARRHRPALAPAPLLVPLRRPDRAVPDQRRRTPLLPAQLLERAGGADRDRAAADPPPRDRRQDPGAVRALAAAAFPALILTDLLHALARRHRRGRDRPRRLPGVRPDRLPKPLTLLMTGAGGGVLILLAHQRSDLVHGHMQLDRPLTGQRDDLLAIVVCVFVGLLQAGLSLAAAAPRGRAGASSRGARRRRDRRRRGRRAARAARGQRPAPVSNAWE